MALDTKTLVIGALVIGGGYLYLKDREETERQRRLDELARDRRYSGGGNIGASDGGNSWQSVANTGINAASDIAKTLIQTYGSGNGRDSNYSSQERT